MSARDRPPDVKAPAGASGERGVQQSGLDGTQPDDSTPEAPEHRGERRRFLVWALMLGAVPPQRVVERVLADVQDVARDLTSS